MIDWSRVGGVGLVGLALLLPWLTWWRLTTPHPHLAVILTPQWLLVCAVLLGLSGWIALSDGWAGALIGWLVLRAVPSTTPGTFEVAYLAVLGGLILVAVRQIPAGWRETVRLALVLGGLAQVAYMCGQALGYDPIWMGWQQGPARVLGTLGNENFAGTYLGILAAIAPWWALPIFALGLGVAHSAVGTLAAGIGLLARYRGLWWGWVGIGAWVSWGAWMRGSDLTASLLTRWTAWTRWYAELDWSNFWVGHGLGSWAFYAKPVWGEWFMQAHNEYVQLGYEAGIIAVLLLFGWLWRYRRNWTGVWGGGAAAVAVTACAMFPFHLAVTALVALIIVGLATNQEAVCESF